MYASFGLRQIIAQWGQSLYKFVLKIPFSRDILYIHIQTFEYHEIASHEFENTKS